ncbi:MAG: M3 family metallopeptidase [Bacteroidales bacterium]|nr:M3 family metallopeptidase [Bacteroidales bacterium]
MSQKLINMIALSVITMASCTSNNEPQAETETPNPFLTEYTTPFQVPPFDQIKNEHYLPAFEAGMKEQLAEVEAIVSNAETPTFENTILPYDKSGQILTRVSNVFFNLNECLTNDEMVKIAETVLPLLSKHSDSIMMNPKLFERIDYVYQHRNEMGLDDQQIRVVEKYEQDFVRNGAALPADKQAELSQINEQLSTLSLQFGNNLLKENSNFKLVIEDKQDLAGLPQTSIDAAAEQAKADGMEGKWVFTLSKPSLIPFLQFADNRDLREQMYKAYYNRGDNNNEYDNKKLINEMVNLRVKKAHLFGYENYADYVLAVNMAQDSKTVDKFLIDIFKPAQELAKKELAEMQAIADAEKMAQNPHTDEQVLLQGWDWWYYAEKLRKAKYDFDENQIKPYLTVDNVRNGMFMAANKLYGVTFTKNTTLPVYYPGVETYEVKEANGDFLGILYMDYYPRESKSGGAWCTEFRTSGHDINGKKIYPVVSLVMNFTPASGNVPALLTWDETETMWHEFGHSLHAFFSDGLYTRTCGNVPHDYVEMPSQIMENWVAEPEVIRMYAKHYETGEPMPDSLIAKIENSALFNQGFMTTELIAASILDMKFHELTEPQDLDVDAFEKQQMDAIGLMREILPRYRSTNFSHIFNGGYSAGYYAYTWAEVLDKDAFNYFKSSGDLFNPELAASFRKNCLQECGNDEGMVQYRKFRGQDPDNEPYLRARGLK